MFITACPEPPSKFKIQLERLLYNRGDLLAKKFGTAGCWMANAVRIKTKLLKLRCGDFSQRDDLLASKYFEEGLQHRETGKLLRLVRCAVAQYAARLIE